MKISKTHLLKLLFTSFVVAISFASFKLFQPELTRSANLTSATATLGNSRISYRAGVDSGTSGATTVTIDGSGNPDNDTNHLFPQDDVCFTQSIPIGCRENTTYNVNDIIDTTSFHTTAALGSTLDATDLVIATQSGSWTIAFTTVTAVPLDGDILITIPMTDNADGNDGFPDAPGTIATGGFDLNGIDEDDISVASAGCANDWTATETVVAGSGTTDHTIRIDRNTSACAGGSDITVTIDSDPGIVNPGPITSHTQGVSDSYQINVRTRDDSGDTLDQVDVIAAPIEAVLISATVDETLSFTVTGQTSDGTDERCNITRTATTPDTSATSVPWGTLPLSYDDATHDTNQLLEVDTNAASGYSVTVIANNQMAKDGTAACTGDAGATDNCIPDTTCQASPCSHTTFTDWTTPDSFSGLGYSLEEITADAAAFEYNDAAAAFNAKQFADEEDGQAAQSIMAEATPVENSQIYICFRIDITALQPAGYYQNYIRYTATGTF